MNIKINSFEKIRWTKVWKNERVEKETDSFENLVDSQNVHQPMISAKGQKKTVSSEQTKHVLFLLSSQKNLEKGRNSADSTT